MKVSLGQHSECGRKEINQDFHGACIPAEPQLGAKGIALVLADGISSSTVSQEASQAAVRTFLEDYYCTSPAWSVKKSAQQVLMAVNSWLFAQTQQSDWRYDKDRGYVCTLSALVLKGNTAHVFHAGDSRVYRLREGDAEQLTQDHRVHVSSQQSYLGRALGIQPHLDVDYLSTRMEAGDVFVIVTDGVHEFLSPRRMQELAREHAQDLDVAARAICREAFERGSGDNLTAVIARVDQLPEPSAAEVQHARAELPFPPALTPRMEIDGYRIVRELHVSSRSHVFLATHADDDKPVALKVPASDLRADPVLLERFVMEDWIAQRVDNPHVLKAAGRGRKRTSLYTVSEYVDGQTLAQWLLDNRKPSLETVRGIVEQIAQGLTAFHRLEMLHQDLRPQNVMIDGTGTVKLIDFGSTQVAGINDSGRGELLGAVQYTAPELFLGEPGSPRSDLFSLAVITYQMLSGRLPYGAAAPRARSLAAQRRLRYQTVLDENREIPAWIDEVLRKATHPDPTRRQEELSEFVHDLRHPGQTWLVRGRPPLLERNPVAFWRGLSLVLALLLLVLAWNLAA